jgi:hypothetical protein
MIKVGLLSSLLDLEKVRSAERPPIQRFICETRVHQDPLQQEFTHIAQLET